MGHEEQDLITAIATATILLRKLEEGVVALLGTDSLRSELIDLRERLERRLEELSVSK
jgi:hypothetical protein